MAHRVGEADAARIAKFRPASGGQLAFEILCLLADSVAARRASREHVP